MSKKFSIIRTVDLDKLFDAINEYVNDTGETNPYIFMNEDTVEAVSKEVLMPYFCPYVKKNMDSKQNGVAAEYCGYKIFRNNSLKFGEIEIR